MSDPKPSDPPQLPDKAADKLIAAVKAMPASKNDQPKPAKDGES